MRSRPELQEQQGVVAMFNPTAPSDPHFRFLESHVWEMRWAIGGTVVMEEEEEEEASVSY